MISVLLIEEKSAVKGDSREDAQLELALYSKKRMGKTMSSKNEIECYYCKKLSHIAINCKVRASDLLKGKAK